MRQELTVEEIDAFLMRLGEQEGKWPLAQRICAAARAWVEQDFKRYPDGSPDHRPQPEPERYKDLWSADDCPECNPTAWGFDDKSAAAAPPTASSQTTKGEDIEQTAAMIIHRQGKQLAACRSQLAECREQRDLERQEAGLAWGKLAERRAELASLRARMAELEAQATTYWNAIDDIANGKCLEYHRPEIAPAARAWVEQDFKRYPDGSPDHRPQPEPEREETPCPICGRWGNGLPSMCGCNPTASPSASVSGEELEEDIVFLRSFGTGRMNDIADLIERLRDERHCNDWYLRLAAADALAQCRTQEAACRAEVERLKDCNVDLETRRNDTARELAAKQAYILGLEDQYNQYIMAHSPETVPACTVTALHDELALSKARVAELEEALAFVIKQTVDWNDAVEKIIGRFPHTGIDLDRARAALTEAENPMTNEVRSCRE